MCNFFFYKIVYYIFNYNYDPNLKIGNNEILNNKVAEQLASNRLWVYILITFNILVTIYFSIYVSLGGQNTGPFILITTLSLTTIYRTIIYICNRKKYGNLNTLSNIEDRSLYLFMNQNSELNNSTFDKTNNFINNTIKILSSTITNMPSLDCLIADYSNNNSNENEPPEEISLSGGSKHEPLTPSPSKRFSNEYNFRGLPWFPNKMYENNSSSNGISVDKLTKDNNYDAYVSDLYSFNNLLWIILVIVIFWVIRESIFGYFYQKFDQLGDSKNYFGVILTEHIMSSLFYFLGSFTILNPLIFKVSDIFSWLWKKIGTNYKTIAKWTIIIIIISVFIIYFIVLVFGLLGNSSRSGEYSAFAIVLIILLGLILFGTFLANSDIFNFKGSNPNHKPMIPPYKQDNNDVSNKNNSRDPYENSSAPYGSDNEENNDNEGENEKNSTIERKPLIPPHRNTNDKSNGKNNDKNSDKSNGKNNKNIDKNNKNIGKNKNDNNIQHLEHREESNTENENENQINKNKLDQLDNLIKEIQESIMGKYNSFEKNKENLKDKWYDSFRILNSLKNSSLLNPEKIKSLNATLSRLGEILVGENKN